LSQELEAVSRCAGEFAERNVKVIGLSCDTRACRKFTDVKKEFPIIADPERKVARLYGMLGYEDDASKGQIWADYFFVSDGTRQTF
jgi:alkyl hydroperoxide reductase subunit AhpC